MCVCWRSSRSITQTFELRVELRSDEDREAGQPKPHEQHRNGSEASVEDGVVRERLHVETEAPRDDEPETYSQRCAGEDASPHSLRMTYRKPIKSAKATYCSSYRKEERVRVVAVGLEHAPSSSPRER